MVRDAGSASGLFGDIPLGAGDGSDLEFAVASTSTSACEWFSDPYIWFVGVTLEAADPTFVETILADRQTFGDGYEAAMISDTEAVVVAGDLLARVTNLPPLNTQTTNDRPVTRALVEAVGERLR